MLWILGLQHRAGVLAAVAVALTDAASGELRAFLRHPGVVHRHDDRRHADLAVHRPDELVLGPDGQLDPLVPFHRSDPVLALDFEPGRHFGGHHAEGFLWRADIDRLPVPVQNQHDGLVQYAAHKISGVCSLLKWLPRRDSHPDLRFQRPAHYCLCHEARRRASRYGAAGNGLPSPSSPSEEWLAEP